MKTRAYLFATLALGLGLPQAAASQRWMPGFVDAELITGWRTESGSQMAALRIVLESGWKTYWRAPGDGGVPPEFNWTGSHNAAEIIIHWPRPTLFDDGGMRTAGYLQEMILPIEVVPTDPAQEVWLAAEVSFGICHDICVPMHVNVRNLLSGPGSATPEIVAALTDLPDRRDGIARCVVEPVLDGVRVTADIRMPPLGTQEVALFELNNVPVWVSESQNTRAGDVLTSVVEIVPYDARPFELDQSQLSITVIDGMQAVEIRGCLG